LAPKNFLELEKMLEFATTLSEPVVIRYPRGNEQFEETNCSEVKLGKAEVIKEGKDISIIAIGKMTQRAWEVVELLEKEKINAEIIIARFLKPLDKELILKSMRKTKRVITIEDNLLAGGLGDAVTRVVNEEAGLDVKVKTFGYNDVFVQHGKTEELEKIHGLDVENIVKKCLH